MDYRKQKPGRIVNTSNSTAGESYIGSNNNSHNQTYSYYQNQPQQYSNSYIGKPLDKQETSLNNDHMAGHNYSQQQAFHQSLNDQQYHSSISEFQNLSLQTDNYNNQYSDKNKMLINDNNSFGIPPVEQYSMNTNTYPTGALPQSASVQQQPNFISQTSYGAATPHQKQPYPSNYQQLGQPQGYVPPTSNNQDGSNYNAVAPPNFQDNVNYPPQFQPSGGPPNQNLLQPQNANLSYTSQPVGVPQINSAIPAATNNQFYTNAPAPQYPSPMMNTHNANSSSQSSSAGFSDNMPNPIIEQRQLDQKYKETTICYHQFADLPPSTQTQFYYKDEGISSPRYIQSTYYVVPSSSKVAKNTKIPLGIVAQPFAQLAQKDSPLLSSHQGDDGPLRCEQCRGYVNIHSAFIDGGKTLVCNLCGHKTNVVDSYFCYLNSSGVRLDRFTRSELCQGSYELSTNKLYCKNNTLPKPPIYIFMFNVSRNSIINGMISVVADILSSIIPKHLPQDTGYMHPTTDPRNGTSGVGYPSSPNNINYPNPQINGYNSNDNHVDPAKLLVRVAFMAYDRRVYFFNVREHTSSPNKQQVEICIDINDPYIPSYKGFIVDPLDCANQIQSLLQDIPKIFANSTVVDTLLGPVIESAVSLLKSNGDCGRLFIFHSMLPNFDVPGKLENRDNSPLFCTENELSVLKPNGSYYTKLAEKCVANGVSVNLFLTTTGYVDIATLGTLCENTGGRIFYYPFFDTKRSGQQLAYDVQSFVARPCAHDAYMKLRVSNGLRVSAIYGCMSMASATDIQLAYIDSDTTIAFELEHDDDLKPGSVVSCQLAVLYTASSGQRRLRIHNIYLRHANDYTEIYRSIGCEASVCLLMKKYCSEILKQNSVTFVGDKLSEYTYQPLLSYIKNCKQSQAHFQQLILPESLKLYPLYMNSLIKSDAFLSRRELGQDGRSMAILRLKSASIADMLLELYPAVYNILDPINNATIEELSQKTHSLSELGIQNFRCSYERLSHDQIYLMVLPHILFLWVGSGINQESFRSLFGVNSIEQIDGVVMETLPAFDNALSNTTRLLVNLVRKHHHPNRFIPISVVKQGGLSENTFRHFMVESKSSKPKSFSYMEFLCFIHKSINEHL